MEIKENVPENASASGEEVLNGVFMYENFW